MNLILLLYVDLIMAPKIIKRNIDVIPQKSISNTNALWKIQNFHAGLPGMMNTSNLGIGCSHKGQEK